MIEKLGALILGIIFITIFIKSYQNLKLQRKNLTVKQLRDIRKAKKRKEKYGNRS